MALLPTPNVRVPSLLLPFGICREVNLDRTHIKQILCLPRKHSPLFRSMHYL